MLHDFSKKTCYINLATKMRYHISDANWFLSVCVSGHVLLFQKQLFVFFFFFYNNELWTMYVSSNMPNVFL